MRKKSVYVFLVLCFSAVLLIAGLADSVQATDCAHEWGAWTGSNGVHHRTCSLCKGKQSLDCSYNDLIVAPECEKEGYTVRTCTVCKDSARVNPVAAPGHAWDDGKVTAEATCVADGVRVYTCNTCQAVREESISATGLHTHTPIPAVDATCTQTGLTEGSRCAVCDTVLLQQEATPKTAHIYGDVHIETQPTCLPGQQYRECTVCQYRQTQMLPPVHAHVKETVQGFPATCTEDGLTDSEYCTACETVFVAQTVIPKTGHAWKYDWKTEPTCLTDGLCDRACQNEGCNIKEENVTVPTDGHKYAVTIPAVAPTCTKDGMSAQISCTVCGDIKTAAAPTSARGHRYEETVNAPTCTQNGSKVYTCSRCKDSYSESIPLLGHAMQEFSRKEPTCTAAGALIKQCTRCGTTYTEPVHALGHDTKQTVISPTCTLQGYTLVSCNRCVFTQHTDFTDPTGHDGDLLSSVQADCLQDGYEYRKCRICDAEYYDNRQSAFGHQWGPGIVKNPTCTQPGTIQTACLRCGEKKSEENAPAAGHSFTKGVCVEDGHRFDCSVCGEQGQEVVRHAYVQREFMPAVKGYTYSCRDCDHKRLGRPLGDPDGDGKTATASDARAALRFAVQLDTPTAVEKAAADVNNDGTVTAEDARHILRASVGLEKKNWKILSIDENGNLL